MNSNRISSFGIFLAGLAISAGVIIATLITAHFKNDSKDFAFYIAFAQLFVFFLTIAGLIIGIKFKSAQLNKSGLWGNGALLVYSVTIIYLLFKAIGVC